jgi:hypothetical protein
MGATVYTEMYASFGPGMAKVSTGYEAGLLAWKAEECMLVQVLVVCMLNMLRMGDGGMDGTISLTWQNIHRKMAGKQQIRQKLMEPLN